MVKKQVLVVVLFLGVFAAVSLTSNTSNAYWRTRRAWRHPQPVMVVQQQPAWVVQRPVYVRTYRRAYRPVWVW
jgi:hypothetical protein